MKSRYITVFLFVLSCKAENPGKQNDSDLFQFSSPVKVVVQGYTGDNMEPFISRDGHYLFFNNLNEPSVNTNIFYADRVNDSLFQYKGEVQGVNSAALDGVASMDSSGNFYFMSTRSYSQSFTTIYRGSFNNGNVTALDTVSGISRHEPDMVNFDVEVSADANTLYFVDGRFNASGQPQTADLVIAIKNGTGFQRLANSDEILSAVNTDELEYAAGISNDELILFFTRVPSVTSGVFPRIFYATRTNKNIPFNKPNELMGAEGFVEAASFSGDSLIYYHKKGNTGFELYSIKRK
ncbi:MAG: hypothetical protein ACHQFX_07380 [Chitinophagales bacterium]